MEEKERTQFNDEVFVEIARSALRNVNEVSRQEKKGALAELTQLVSERIAPQIIVKRIDRTNAAQTEAAQAVAFDMKLTLIYGVRIPDVVEKVRNAVITEVETLTGFKVDRIDILVEKLIRPEPIAETATIDKEV
jgi:uncharacterized alkaline shock family protein YloU